LRNFDLTMQNLMTKAIKPCGFWTAVVWHYRIATLIRIETYACATFANFHEWPSNDTKSGATGLTRHSAKLFQDECSTTQGLERCGSSGRDCWSCTLLEALRLALRSFAFSCMRQHCVSNFVNQRTAVGGLVLKLSGTPGDHSS